MQIFIQVAHTMRHTILIGMFFPHFFELSHLKIRSGRYISLAKTFYTDFLFGLTTPTKISIEIVLLASAIVGKFVCKGAVIFMEI